jgi:hypothetical protein
MNNIQGKTILYRGNSYFNLQLLLGSNQHLFYAILDLIITQKIYFQYNCIEIMYGTHAILQYKELWNSVMKICYYKPLV